MNRFEFDYDGMAKALKSGKVTAPAMPAPPDVAPPDVAPPEQEASLLSGVGDAYQGSEDFSRSFTETVKRKPLPMIAGAAQYSLGSAINYSIENAGDMIEAAIGVNPLTMLTDPETETPVEALQETLAQVSVNQRNPEALRTVADILNTVVSSGDAFKSEGAEMMNSYLSFSPDEGRYLTVSQKTFQRDILKDPFQENSALNAGAFVGNAIASVLPATVAIAAPQLSVPVMAVYFAQGFAGAANDYEQTLRDRGEIPDQTVAIAHGLGGGTIEVLAERFALGSFFKARKAVKSAVSARLGRAIVAEASEEGAEGAIRTATRTIVDVLPDSVKAGGRVLLANGMEEYSVQVANNLREMLTYDPETKPGIYGQGARLTRGGGEAFLGGLVGGSPFAATAAMSGAGSDQQRMEARTQAEQLRRAMPEEARAIPEDEFVPEAEEASPEAGPAATTGQAKTTSSPQVDEMFEGEDSDARQKGARKARATGEAPRTGELATDRDDFLSEEYADRLVADHPFFVLKLLEAAKKNKGRLSRRIMAMVYRGKNANGRGISTLDADSRKQFIDNLILASKRSPTVTPLRKQTDAQLTARLREIGKKVEDGTDTEEEVAEAGKIQNILDARARKRDQDRRVEEEGIAIDEEAAQEVDEEVAEEEETLEEREARGIAEMSGEPLVEAEQAEPEEAEDEPAETDEVAEEERTSVEERVELIDRRVEEIDSDARDALRKGDFDKVQDLEGARNSLLKQKDSLLKDSQAKVDSAADAAAPPETIPPPIPEKPKKSKPKKDKPKKDKPKEDKPKDEDSSSPPPPSKPGDDKKVESPVRRLLNSGRAGIFGQAKVGKENEELSSLGRKALNRIAGREKVNPRGKQLTDAELIENIVETRLFRAFGPDVGPAIGLANTIGWQRLSSPERTKAEGRMSLAKLIESRRALLTPEESAGLEQPVVEEQRPLARSKSKEIRAKLEERAGRVLIDAAKKVYKKSGVVFNPWASSSTGASVNNIDADLSGVEGAESQQILAEAQAEARRILSKDRGEGVPVKKKTKREKEAAKEEAKNYQEEMTKRAEERRSRINARNTAADEAISPGGLGIVEPTEAVGEAVDDPTEGIFEGAQRQRDGRPERKPVEKMKKTELYDELIDREYDNPTLRRGRSRKQIKLDITNRLRDEGKKTEGKGGLGVLRDVVRESRESRPVDLGKATPLTPERRRELDQRRSDDVRQSGILRAQAGWRNRLGEGKPERPSRSARVTLSDHIFAALEQGSIALQDHKKKLIERIERFQSGNIQGVIQDSRKGRRQRDNKFWGTRNEDRVILLPKEGETATYPLLTQAILDNMNPDAPNTVGPETLEAIDSQFGTDFAQETRVVEGAKATAIEQAQIDLAQAKKKRRENRTKDNNNLVRRKQRALKKAEEAQQTELDAAAKKKATTGEVDTGRVVGRGFDSAGPEGLAIAEDIRLVLAEAQLAGEKEGAARNIQRSNNGEDILINARTGEAEGTVQAGLLGLSTETVIADIARTGDSSGVIGDEVQTVETREEQRIRIDAALDISMEDTGGRDAEGMPPEGDGIEAALAILGMRVNADGEFSAELDNDTSFSLGGSSVVVLPNEAGGAEVVGESQRWIKSRNLVARMTGRLGETSFGTWLRGKTAEVKNAREGQQVSLEDANKLIDNATKSKTSKEAGLKKGDLSAVPDSEANPAELSVIHAMRRRGRRVVLYRANNANGIKYNGFVSGDSNTVFIRVGSLGPDVFARIKDRRARKLIQREYERIILQLVRHENTHLLERDAGDPVFVALVDNALDVSTGSSMSDIFNSPEEAETYAREVLGLGFDEARALAKTSEGRKKIVSELRAEAGSQIDALRRSGGESLYTNRNIAERALDRVRRSITRLGIGLSDPQAQAALRVVDHEIKLNLYESGVRVETNTTPMERRVRFSADLDVRDMPIVDYSAVDVDFSMTRADLTEAAKNVIRSDRATAATEKFVDRNVRLRRAKQDIEMAFGTKLEDEINPIQLLDISPGLVSRKSQVFMEDQYVPILRELGENNISEAEMGEFMHARHAKEANEYLREAKGDERDSGMTDEQADAILERVRNRSDSEVFDKVADKIDAITRDSLEIMRDAGLITQEDYDNINDKYSHYVPLADPTHDKKFEREGEEPIAGVTMIGRTTQFRQGKDPTANLIDEENQDKREAFHKGIIVHIATQRARIVRRAIQNQSYNRLVDMAAAFDSDKTFVIEKGIRRKDGTLDFGAMESKGTLEVSIIARANRDMVINGVTYRKGTQIVVRPKDPKMAAALRERGKSVEDVVGSVGKVMRGYTSFKRSMVTRFNLNFTLVNPVRDMQEASATMKGLGFDKVRRGLLKNIGPATRSAMAYAFGNGTKSNDPLYQEYLDSGAQQSIYRLQDARQTQRAIEDEINKVSRGRGISIRNLSDATIGRALGSVSNLTNALDDSVRYAAWRLAKEQGLTTEQATAMSRDVTVDFSRSGTSTWINDIYAFSNVSVQGARKLKERGVSKVGRKVFYRAIAYGFLANALNLLVFDDDEWEEIPEYIRDTNYILPLPFTDENGKRRYLKIPLPPGLGSASVFGMTMADALRGDTPNNVGTRLWDGAKRTAASVGNLNPFGGAGPFSSINGLALGISPDITDPLVALYGNEDWKGQKIYRPANSFDRNEKRSEAGWGSTEGMWKGIATTVSDLTFGTAVEGGRVDWTPEAFRYLATNYLLMGSFKDATNFITDVFDETQESDFSETIVLRRFTGVPNPGQRNRELFYEYGDRLAVAEDIKKEIEERGITSVSGATLLGYSPEEIRQYTDILAMKSDPEIKKLMNVVTRKLKPIETKARAEGDIDTLKRINKIREAAYKKVADRYKEITK